MRLRLTFSIRNVKIYPQMCQCKVDNISGGNSILSGHPVHYVFRSHYSAVASAPRPAPPDIGAHKKGLRFSVRHRTDGASICDFRLRTHIMYALVVNCQICCALSKILLPPQAEISVNKDSIFNKVWTRYQMKY